MMDDVSKFSEPGELVMDRFWGTFATGKAYMMLAKHRVFVRCEKDSECFQPALPSLVEMYARQVLNPELGIEDGKEVKTAARAFILAMRMISSKRRKDDCSLPVGLPAVQTFPPDIVHSLGRIYKDVTLYEKYRHIPLLQWSDK